MSDDKPDGLIVSRRVRVFSEDKTEARDIGDPKEHEQHCEAMRSVCEVVANVLVDAPSEFGDAPVLLAAVRDGQLKLVRASAEEIVKNLSEEGLLTPDRVAKITAPAPAGQRKLIVLLGTSVLGVVNMKRLVMSPGGEA